MVNHSQIVAMSFVDKLIGPFPTSNSYKKFFVHELVQHMKTLNHTFQIISVYTLLLLLLYMAFHTLSFMIKDTLNHPRHLFQPGGVFGAIQCSEDEVRSDLDE